MGNAVFTHSAAAVTRKRAQGESMRVGVSSSGQGVRVILRTCFSVMLPSD